jgi:hypothetical protein
VFNALVTGPAALITPGCDRPLVLSLPHQFPHPPLTAADDLGGRTRKDRPDGRSFLTLIVGLSTLASWPALDLQIEPAILSW